jgi:tripartite-type tricarboxylate transporter receptor subunit TctC
MLRRLLMLSCLIFPTVGHAQDFPTRPVQIVVPTSPAGITDIAARVIGDKLSRIWGQQVVIQNRPGGGGTVGVLSVARATADGYTLLMTTNGELALAAAIRTSVPYDWRRDFLPLALATKNPITIAANASSPFTSLKSVVEAAKQHPGDVAWASPGVGTWNHLTGEWFADALGIKLLHVPYKGGGPSGTAVAAGDVPLGFLAISSALPHVQSGRARVLAVASAQRSPLAPSWPTVTEELGVTFDSGQWVGLFAPAGIPAALRDKIEHDVLEALAAPEVRDRFTRAGVDVIAQPGAAAFAQLEIDVQTATRISAKTGMKID